MAEPVVLLALAVDAAVGWPAAVYARVGHPVGAFARIIGWCERRWNDPVRRSATRRLLGALTLTIVVGVAAGAAWLAQVAVGGNWIAVALMAAPALAQRSLYDHVVPVARALAADDLPAARRSVAMIVGRDTAALDEAGVARAAIESLAESFCDGIAAPLFWLIVGGLPGIWAYKAINTADSLIGHREDRWRAFGWAAARTDDVANLIPARLAGVAICLAGAGGWRTMLRDARRHASPNAGWPEAAMAGALGVRLAGPVSYDGVVHDKPWIGCDSRCPTSPIGGSEAEMACPQSDFTASPAIATPPAESSETGRFPGTFDTFAGRDAAPADLRRALHVYLRACALLWIVAGAVAWAR